MKRKMFLFLGIGIFLFSAASLSWAQFYEINYPGCAFDGFSESIPRFFDSSGSLLQIAGQGSLFCPVYFPASANGMNISRFSMTYYDDDVSASVVVGLYKKDRWTGIKTEVALLQSSAGGAVAGVRYLNLPKSQMAATGIDNNRFAWFMTAAIFPASSNAWLCQVTIRYQ